MSDGKSVGAPERDDRCKDRPCRDAEICDAPPSSADFLVELPLARLESFDMAEAAEASQGSSRRDCLGD